jgi:hypothetical protein
MGVFGLVVAVLVGLVLVLLDDMLDVALPGEHVRLGFRADPSGRRQVASGTDVVLGHSPKIIVWQGSGLIFRPERLLDGDHGPGRRPADHESCGQGP